MRVSNGFKRHRRQTSRATSRLRVSQLKHRFNPRGISEDDFWNAVKVDLGVASRSEIDEVGYVRLAARLQTAEKHMHMFESLCREIKAK